MNLDELKCSICFDWFGSSSREPRILCCGHTFCVECLSYTLSHQPASCATCRHQIYSLNVNQLSVNYIVKTLAVESKLISKEGFCELHDQPKICECLECNVVECDVCSILYHKRCKLERTQTEILSNNDPILNETTRELSKIGNSMETELFLIEKIQCLIQLTSDLELKRLRMDDEMKSTKIHMKRFELESKDLNLNLLTTTKELRWAQEKIQQLKLDATRGSLYSFKKEFNRSKKRIFNFFNIIKSSFVPVNTTNYSRLELEND